MYLHLCGSCGALGCDRARWSWVRAHVGGLGARWRVVWTRRVGLRMRNVRCAMQDVIWHVFVLILVIPCVPSSVVPSHPSSHPSSAHFFRSSPVVRRCRVRFRTCAARCCMCDMRGCHFGIVFVFSAPSSVLLCIHSGVHTRIHTRVHTRVHSRVLLLLITHRRTGGIHAQERYRAYIPPGQAHRSIHTQHGRERYVWASWRVS